jgi:HK97 family phage prohead protease
MPMRYAHGDEIGRIVALRRAHGNLYAIAESELEPHELQALAGEDGLRWSTGTYGRRDDPLTITELSLVREAATVALPPVQWHKERVSRGNLPQWVASELERAAKAEHRSRGELRVHEVGLDAVGEYEQVGRDLQLLGGEHRYNPTAPIELRHATLADVSFPDRTIEVVAVPYGQEALVEYRGETWHEHFVRGAFDGVEKQPDRVKANRDHDKTRLVGKAVGFWPDREEGLVGAFRIAKTPLGDETLALASENMLGASVGFGARGSDQVFDRSTRRRSIKRAFLDHLAFVPDSAYEGAQVVAVRKR